MARPRPTGPRKATEDTWMAAWGGVGDACLREEGPRAGHVALEGSLGSAWPRMRRGRGPPAAYGRAAAKQRGERETGTRLQILKVQEPPGKLKLSPS